MVRASRTIAAPPEAVRAHLLEIEHLSEFEGYGLIPGIRSAHWERGARAELGAIRLVENTDGSKHREQVMQLDDSVVEDRIFDFDSPLRHLAAEALDRFELSPAPGGMRIDRSFTISLKSSVFLPIGWAIANLFLRPAMKRHLDRIAQSLTGGR
jgi:hypothetical protein